MNGKINDHRIGIIDYGMGNLKSVANALEELGCKGIIISTAEEVFNYEKIILPGVGAFGEAMENLKNAGFDEAIKEFVSKGKFILGICLGMQLLCNDSQEDGFFKGLGLIDANVLPFKRVDKLKVPHMGWNSIHLFRDDFITHNILDGNDVYFVHSFYVKNNCEDDILAVTEYGLKFTSIMRRDNVIGMQFHPEKSQEVGLRLLNSFIFL